MSPHGYCNIALLAVATLLCSPSSTVTARRGGGGFFPSTRSALYHGNPIHIQPSFHRRRTSSASSSSSLSSTGTSQQQQQNLDHVFSSPQKVVTSEWEGQCGSSNVEPQVQMVSAAAASGAASGAGAKIARNLIRGAVLRIASDITGGTPLEAIKTRATVSTDGPLQSYRHVIQNGGIPALWAGTPSRTIEGALMGAFFLVGSAATKKLVLANGGGPALAALCGGFVGGIAQAVVMTPAGMVFTSLNVNKNKPGYENDTFFSVTRRIVNEKGIRGMFVGGTPMAVRQSTNWATRAGLTEVARTTFRMSQFGIWGELASGAIGGVGSCWNTPVETVRVLMQQDFSRGLPTKGFGGYVSDIVERDGPQGLFRGVTPRGIQAIWQTVFMVVVPNILGV